MGLHKIPRLTDRDIAAKLETIQSEITGGEVLGVRVTAFGQGITGVALPNPTSEAWLRLLEANGSAIETLGLTFNGISFNYYRSGQSDPRSAYFDEISIKLQDADPERVRQGAKLTAIFRPVNVPPAPNDESGETLRALQESRIGQLEQVLRDAVERAAKHNDDVEKRFLARVDDLEQQFGKRRDELQAEIGEAQARVKADEEALELRKKALDDRGNTHARREIRDRMLADIQTRIGTFGVSRNTETKRRPVEIGIFTLVAVLLFFAAAALWEIRTLEESRFQLAVRVVTAAASASSPGSAPMVNATPAVNFDAGMYWAAWVRLALLSFGVVATLVYYIRWQNQWAERHSQSEFALQQFQLDVNRANWVLESCLEWRKETSSPIPRELLESVTRGLFVPTDAPAEPALNPADELAKAILGSSSKLKLKAGDSEIELDKPGKIKPAAG